MKAQTLIAYLKNLSLEKHNMYFIDSCRPTDYLMWLVVMHIRSQKFFKNQII